MTDARAWTRAALVGSLWGALELTLGSLLHLSRPSYCFRISTVFAPRVS